jgi:hypothetical protein
MKQDEIEIIDLESEVEVLGVENVEGTMLENEGAFIVDIDDYSDCDTIEIIDMDMPQEDDVF